MLRLHLFAGCCLCCNLLLSKEKGPNRTAPLVRSGTLLATSSSESGQPEASTPQHLPSLAFLRPSTVFSSDDEPVFFHTGTAFRVQRTETDSPGFIPPPHWVHPEGRIPRCGCETRGRRKWPKPLTWVATSYATTCRLLGQTAALWRPCRRVTHQRRHEWRHWEGGSSTSQAGFGPTNMRNRESQQLPATLPVARTDVLLDPRIQQQPSPPHPNRHARRIELRQFGVSAW